MSLDTDRNDTGDREEECRSALSNAREGTTKQKKGSGKQSVQKKLEGNNQQTTKVRIGGDDTGRGCVTR